MFGFHSTVLCRNLAVLLAMFAFATAAHGDPVSQWRFENDFSDSTGNNDLTPSGSPAFSSTVPPGGFSSTSLSLDGSSFLLNSTSDSFTATNQYTIAGWIQTDVNGISGHRGIFSRSPDGGGSTDIEVYLQVSTNDLVVAHNRDDGGPSPPPEFGFVGFQDPPDETLFHLAITFDNGTITAFYDGVQASIVQQDDQLPIPDLTLDHQVNVGSIESTFGDIPLTGLIDEFVVFDRVLTAEELQNLRVLNSVFPIPEPNSGLLVGLGVMLLARRRLGHAKGSAAPVDRIRSAPGRLL